MRTKLFAAAAVAGVAMAFIGAGSASAAEGDASLSVLHGVPDMKVDVYVNDKLTLDDFAPGDLAGPLKLAAGTYTVAITASDAKDASKPAIGPVDLKLDSGMNYTAVAHLDEAGKPTATLFTNDISKTKAGEGRLTVRHVAAAPAVDVLAGDTAVIKSLMNPDEKVLNLPASKISASVAAAGTKKAVVGPADVNVAEGVNTIVYAWGSLADDNLDLAVQTIDGLHSAPAGVPSGELGLADTSSNTATWTVLALLAAAAGVFGVRRLVSSGARN